MLCLSLVVKYSVYKVIKYSVVVAAENHLDNQKLFCKQTNPVAIYPIGRAAIAGPVHFESPADSKSQRFIMEQTKAVFPITLSNVLTYRHVQETTNLKTVSPNVEFILPTKPMH